MTLTCPACQTDFDTELSLGEFPRCPHCGQTVVLDEPSDDLARQMKEDELSGLRILQLSRQRRSAIRHRSHLLIFAAVCLVAAAQLVVSLLRLAVGKGAWHPPALPYTLLFTVLYLLGLILALRFGRRCLTHAAELKESLSHSDLTEPPTPPDYSTLSDGSKHLRALDDMTQPESPPSPPPPPRDPA